MFRPLWSLVVLLVAGPAQATELPTELTDYVGKADASFRWKLAGTSTKGGCTIYSIDLVSQTWHGVAWDHKLQVFVPKEAKPRATMGLWTERGEPSLVTNAIGTKLATTVKAPIAILFGVPKQPLYDGKAEDALVAESFVRFLTTQDASWPLLFPMVKSTVRAMDALQEFAREHWQFEVKNFVLAGASKRGWSTWLTAATGDKRVKAIAPLVFDTLNLPVQMANQVKAYGQFSEAIKDYRDRLLIPIPKTEPARRLWHMIDPWTYREKFTMPMLVINGTNDEFWLADGLNEYWDGLPGQKWVMYVPNAGHYLCKRDKEGAEEGQPWQAMGTLCAFCRAHIFDQPMPKLDYKLLCPPGAACLDINLACDIKPTAARLYCAQSDTRDFRKCWWEARPLDLTGNRTTCKVDVPAKGFSAGVVELEFEIDGAKFHLSTPLRILEAKK